MPAMLHPNRIAVNRQERRAVFLVQSARAKTSGVVVKRFSKAAMAARRAVKHERRQATIKLNRTGLKLGPDTVPLLSGAVHYFALEPSDWQDALKALVQLGLRCVDTYVPWSLHEIAPGELDFGRHSARLDVVRFLRLAHELGLLAIVRPGPHVNAELTYFGIPARVVWDPECQARSPAGQPVVLPAPPLAFPVPSYASEAFLTEAAQWLAAVAEVLAPLTWPEGPIVMVQLDNEACLYFRDGVYDQDHHRDSISAYRRFLQNKYERLETLRQAHGDPAVTFAKIEPPRRLNASAALELCRHLDWAEYQEHSLEAALVRMRQALRAGGLSRVATMHNLPPADTRTPLDPARLDRVVDLVGADFYHRASAASRAAIARRASELQVRADAHARPAYASELGAGFPYYFAPLSESDSAFAALTCLAYGVRGFNVYMAVERDRWIGAPFDRRGRRRAAAEFWHRLLDALERTQFYELKRVAQVKIVVPRSLRRLTRVLHGFGPASLALFELVHRGVESACFEEELGLPGPVAIECERFLQSLERELDARGVAYAYASGDLIQHCLDDAVWTIVACSGALESDIARAVSGALKKRRAVTLGPYFHERDDSMRPLERASPIPYLREAAIPSLLGANPPAIARTVEQAVRRLKPASVSVEPNGIHATMHEDAAGRARVLFVINPSDVDVDVRVAGFGPAVDALDGQPIQAAAGSLELLVPHRSVRMLELELQT
jgi:beta-galactosidase